MFASSPATAVSVRTARPVKFTLEVSLEGFDILFYECKCISKEIALHNFAPIATRLWREDQSTEETPNIAVIRNGKRL
jgi:hypothetical protein